MGLILGKHGSLKQILLILRSTGLFVAMEMPSVYANADMCN